MATAVAPRRGCPMVGTRGRHQSESCRLGSISRVERWVVLGGTSSRSPADHPIPSGAPPSTRHRYLSPADQTREGRRNRRVGAHRVRRTLGHSPAPDSRRQGLIRVIRGPRAPRAVSSSCRPWHFAIRRRQHGASTPAGTPA